MIAALENRTGDVDDHWQSCPDLQASISSANCGVQIDKAPLMAAIDRERFAYAVAARSKLATIATNFYQIRAIVRCSNDESLGELPHSIGHRK